MAAPIPLAPPVINADRPSRVRDCSFMIMSSPLQRRRPGDYAHSMSHLPGIAAKTVQTPRLRSNVLYRDDVPAGTVPLVFVHGNASSSLFWEPLMLALPPEINAVAVDLRGYGDSEVAAGRRHPRHPGLQ